MTPYNHWIARAPTGVLFGKMAKSAISILSFLLNIIYVASGVLLALASVVYYTEMKVIKDVRNSDLHVISSGMSWPEMVPYIFFGVGVAVAVVSMCGFGGAYSKVALIVYIVFLTAAVSLTVAATIIVIQNADSEKTDEVIGNIIAEGFGEITGDVIRSGDDTAFGILEEKYSCCGDNHSNEYIHKTPEHLYPKSCCRSDHPCQEHTHGDVVQTRLGCRGVVIHKARRFIMYLWWGCAGVSGIGAVNLVIAVLALILTIVKDKKINKRRNLQQTQILRVNGASSNSVNV